MCTTLTTLQDLSYGQQKRKGGFETHRKKKGYSVRKEEVGNVLV